MTMHFFAAKWTYHTSLVRTVKTVFSFAIMTEDETSHINIELTQSLDGSLHDILPERRANSM